MKYLSKSRKTEVKTQLIFELIRNLTMPYLFGLVQKIRKN